MIRRREFMALLGGAAAWPLAAQAQPGDRVRRIGVLMGGLESDPVQQARLAAFLESLAQLGWTDGRNVRIDTRWYAGGADRSRTYAAELIGLAPDVILASASAGVAALQQASRSAPIVFANVIDPVGAGFVASLAQPGGNATGFTAFEYGISGKWLELLKEIAPRVTRAAVLRDPAVASGIGQPCRRTRRFPAPLRQSVRRWPCPSWVGCATIISERRFPTGTGRSDTLLLWELQLAGVVAR
jgi:putative ABC transport system substrate-binding protein